MARVNILRLPHRVCCRKCGEPMVDIDFSRMYLLNSQNARLIFYCPSCHKPLWIGFDARSGIQSILDSCGQYSNNALEVPE